MYKVIEVIN